ncbi:MAG TPA: RHS repeat-associated core domain-containing protein [Gammaproteobacteria bacterium]|nr:RHS repeat-associated core domain-containing protein [Gammaproteobacteria bacterium]
MIGHEQYVTYAPVPVHMNGRVYDPSLGRFLSVDPVFEFPTNMQSLNPYSYVLNNPLSMTDPTGYAAAAPSNTGTCPDGTACPDQSSASNSGGSIKPGDTATITIKSTSTSIGSHIAQTTTTTLTGVAQADGSVAVYGSSSTQNGGSNSQSATDMQNEPTGSAGIGSPAQTSKRSLSSKSEEAIESAAKKHGYDAIAFENAITGSAAKNKINPNLLVGLAYKGSTLNPDAGNGGLFQIQPRLQKDLGISDNDLKNYRSVIPKVATALSNAIKTFHGNVDLGVASWTLGVGGTRRLYSEGGISEVRNALLDKNHPDWGRVGPQYIDVVKRYLEPEEN